MSIVVKVNQVFLPDGSIKPDEHIGTYHLPVVPDKGEIFYIEGFPLFRVYTRSWSIEPFSKPNNPVGEYFLHCTLRVCTTEDYEKHLVYLQGLD